MTTLPAERDRRGVAAVVGYRILVNFAGRYPHHMDGVGDHVSGAL